MGEQKKKATITCPHCGWEYLPAEVFYPGELFGKPKPSSIVRDALGKILYVEYEDNEEPEQQETFECENCGRLFAVEPVVSYKTKEAKEEEDFTDLYVNLLD